MKLLLINPPKELEIAFAVPDDYEIKARSNQPPLGIMYLYSYLSDKFDVSILDMNVEEATIQSIDSRLEEHQPDLVGITCVVSRWETVIQLSKRIKDFNPKIQIVVGGVNPSMYTYETLQCPSIDYVVRGFGQEPLLKLCQNFNVNTIQSSIENCFTKENYKTNIPGTFSFGNVDHYPLPDRRILPAENYTLPYCLDNPTTSMISSCGCPFNCHFCQGKTFKPVIMRDVNKVVAEMEEIQSLGIKSIMFQDELFTASDARIQEICSLILAKNINLHWSVRARGTPLKPQSLDLMKKAGCFNIHMGIESGNSRILKKMNKKITVEQATESIRRINAAGIFSSASFMLGYPTETKEEIMETIDFAANTNLHNCQFYITIPPPRTVLYKEWQKNTGYKEDIFSEFVLNPKSVDLNNMIASDLFTKQEMDNFVNIAFSKTNNLYKTKGTK
jgi:radical SAM superfamily enzyme YgiQ (UPF0313 family)